MTKRHKNDVGGAAMDVGDIIKEFKMGKKSIRVINDEQGLMEPLRASLPHDWLGLPLIIESCCYFENSSRSFGITERTFLDYQAMLRHFIFHTSLIYLHRSRGMRGIIALILPHHKDLFLKLSLIEEDVAFVGAVMVRLN